MSAHAVDSIDEDEVVRLTSELVRIDTSNPPGNEAAAARCLGQYLTDGGVGVEYVEVEPGRTMVIARLPGERRDGFLTFSGHLDTVPARESGWVQDPFTPVQMGDRLVGRGTADMKGGIAAMAVALVALRRSGFVPRSDIVLIASVGEELGMTGARYLAAGTLLRECGYLVVGEPTGLEVCPAQRGAIAFRLTLHGRGAHSSMPERGVSAISAMARVIAALESHRFPYQPSDFLGAPSVNVGMIEGGVAMNIVPDRCTVAASIRLVSGQSPERAETEVREVIDGAVNASGLPVRAELEMIAGVPPIETQADHPLMRSAVEAVREVRGDAPRVRGFTGGTEAAYLCPAFGMPMVIVGPGELEQAHEVNESVSVRELGEAARVYVRLVKDLLA